ncbi:hypothetical protein HGRIS_014938 [Hohenbuehelia grisea]
MVKRRRYNVLNLGSWAVKKKCSRVDEDKENQPETSDSGSATNRKTSKTTIDFVNVESLLEQDARSEGCRVIFLPKFHCELNFIEQCWGFSKRRYRMYPPSSKEEDLEANVRKAIEEVPLIAMRR